MSRPESPPSSGSASGTGVPAPALDATADAVCSEGAERLRSSGAGPLVFTCEHASQRVPGLEVTAADQRLLDDHWGWDLGAAEVVRALSALTDGPAVLSRFSRLVIDPNRDLFEPSLIVTETHDGPVQFNAGLTEEERQRRIDTYWADYHAACDQLVAERLKERPVRLVSVHSFTPVWLGHPRPTEIGVLFDEHHEHALQLRGAIAEQGFETSLNEPYTGKSGLIYSVARHARRHGVPFMELEIRNDLIRTPEQVADVAGRLRKALRAFEP